MNKFEIENLELYYGDFKAFRHYGNRKKSQKSCFFGAIPFVTFLKILFKRIDLIY